MPNEIDAEYDCEGNLAYAEFTGADIELSQYGYGYMIRIDGGENAAAVIRLSSRTPIECRIESVDEDL